MTQFVYRANSLGEAEERAQQAADDLCFFPVRNVEPAELQEVEPDGTGVYSVEITEK
jgi:hypothetical protein